MNRSCFIFVEKNAEEVGVSSNSVCLPCSGILGQKRTIFMIIHGQVRPTPHCVLPPPRPTVDRYNASHRSPQLAYYSKWLMCSDIHTSHHLAGQRVSCSPLAFIAVRCQQTLTAVTKMALTVSMYLLFCSQVTNEAFGTYGVWPAAASSCRATAWFPGPPY